MARYDSMRKIERNGLMVRYRREHPDASLKEIGDLFKVSAQRVWEILRNGELAQEPARTTRSDHD